MDTMPSQNSSNKQLKSVEVALVVMIIIAAAIWYYWWSTSSPDRMKQEVLNKVNSGAPLTDQEKKDVFIFVSDENNSDVQYTEEEKMRIIKALNSQ